MRLLKEEQEIDARNSTSSSLQPTLTVRSNQMLLNVLTNHSYHHYHKYSTNGDCCKFLRLQCQCQPLARIFFDKHLDEEKT